MVNKYGSRFQTLIMHYFFSRKCSLLQHFVTEEGTLSNIEDGMELFVKIVDGFRALTNFCEKLHLRYFTGFSIRLFVMSREYYENLYETLMNFLEHFKK